MTEIHVAYYMTKKANLHILFNYVPLFYRSHISLLRGDHGKQMSYKSTWPSTLTKPVKDGRHLATWPKCWQSKQVKITANFLLTSTFLYTWTKYKSMVQWLHMDYSMWTYKCFIYQHSSLPYANLLMLSSAIAVLDSCTKVTHSHNVLDPWHWCHATCHILVINCIETVYTFSPYWCHRHQRHQLDLYQKFVDSSMQVLNLNAAVPSDEVRRI